MSKKQTVSTGKTVYIFNRKLFGDMIFAKRKELDLSFRDVQNEIGIAGPVIHTLEQGHSAPTAARLAEICTWLKLEPGFFFIAKKH